jgi:hypothetical protein
MSNSLKKNKKTILFFSNETNYIYILIKPWSSIKLSFKSSYIVHIIWVMVFRKGEPQVARFLKNHIK